MIRQWVLVAGVMAGAAPSAWAAEIDCILQKEIECLLGSCNERAVTGSFIVNAAGTEASLCFTDFGNPTVCTKKPVKMVKTNRGIMVAGIPEDNKSVVSAIINPQGTQVALSDFFTSQLTFLRFGTCEAR